MKALQDETLKDKTLLKRPEDSGYVTHTTSLLKFTSYQQEQEFLDTYPDIKFLIPHFTDMGLIQHVAYMSFRAHLRALTDPKFIQAFGINSKYLHKPVAAILAPSPETPPTKNRHSHKAFSHKPSPVATPTTATGTTTQPKRPRQGDGPVNLGHDHQVPKAILYNPATADLGPTFYPNTCSQQYTAGFESIRYAVRHNLQLRPHYKLFMDTLVEVVDKQQTPAYLYEVFQRKTQAPQEPEMNQHA
jgi:hypothetical protein